MRLTLCILALGFATGGAQAQEGGDEDRAAGRVPYSYAHSGTGFFSIGGESTQVVRIPFAYHLRPAEDGRWGIKLKFPLSFGAHEFEIREGLERPLKETVETIALAVGVELEIPVRENWQLEPYVEAGLGKRISGSEEAFLYRGGVKSLWLMPREQVEIRVGAAVKLEGFELFDGEIRDSYGIAEVGSEARRPAGFEIKDRPADFGVYLIARRFFPEIELSPRGADLLVVEHQMEVGLTFGTEPSIPIWGLDAPRIGVAYRWGDGLTAYRLNFGFPF